MMPEVASLRVKTNKKKKKGGEGGYVLQRTNNTSRGAHLKRKKIMSESRLLENEHKEYDEDHQTSTTSHLLTTNMTTPNKTTIVNFVKVPLVVSYAAVGS